MEHVSGPSPASHKNQIAVVIGVTIFSLTVATIAVAVRTYTRKWIVDRMGIDDYFAIVALVSMTYVATAVMAPDTNQRAQAIAYGCGTSILCMTEYGLGTHISEIDLSLLSLYLKTFYVSIVLYCAGLFAIKMTFLLQYYRVFAVLNLRYVFIAAIIMVGGWSLSQLFVGIFSCIPISGYWDKTIDSTCISNYPQWYINAAGNIFTDLAIFFLPMPILRKLNLPKPQRLVLFGIFSLGFFTLAISVFRIKYLKLFEDFTWENVESSSWSMAELCSGITCSCLPTLRPFVTRHFRSLDSVTRISTPGDRPDSNRPALETRQVDNTELAEAGRKSSDTDDHLASPREATGATGYTTSHGGQGQIDPSSSGPAGRIYETPGDSDRLAIHEYGGRRGDSRTAVLGLLPTIRTTVDGGGSSGTSPTTPSGNVIQIQREVFQVKQDRLG